jgi:hypothetical protein
MGESFEDQLYAETPPERIDSLAVDFLGLTRTSPYRKALQFSWNRNDGETLTYYRWEDEDGEWFYPYEEVLRRREAHG